MSKLRTEPEAGTEGEVSSSVAVTVAASLFSTTLASLLELSSVFDVSSLLLLATIFPVSTATVPESDVEALSSEEVSVLEVSVLAVLAVLEEAVSEEAVSEEAVSEEAVSDEAVSEEAVSEEAVSEEVVSDEAVSEEAVSSVLAGWAVSVLSVWSLVASAAVSSWQFTVLSEASTSNARHVRCTNFISGKLFSNNF